MTTAVLHQIPLDHLRGLDALIIAVSVHNRSPEFLPNRDIYSMPFLFFRMCLLLRFIRHNVIP